MTTWDLFCALYFDELVVLGPKCRTTNCTEPARFTVHWPGPSPIVCCERCTTRWQELALRGLGFTVAVQPLHYTTKNEDAAVQRFRAMELT